MTKEKEFLLKVRELAKEYDLPFFCVTEGASMYSNNGSDAIRNARNCHIQWELENGSDPYEDWTPEQQKNKGNKGA